jgi:hypothetical protein
MPELWSEPETNASGFDLIDDCCFTGCFEILLVCFIMSLPIIAFLYALLG